MSEQVFSSDDGAVTIRVPEGQSPTLNPGDRLRVEFATEIDGPKGCPPGMEIKIIDGEVVWDATGVRLTPEELYRVERIVLAQRLPPHRRILAALQRIDGGKWVPKRGGVPLTLISGITYFDGITQVLDYDAHNALELAGLDALASRFDEVGIGHHDDDPKVVAIRCWRDNVEHDALSSVFGPTRAHAIAEALERMAGGAEP